MRHLRVRPAARGGRAWKKRTLRRVSGTRMSWWEGTVVLWTQKTTPGQLSRPPRPRALLVQPQRPLIRPRPGSARSERGRAVTDSCAARRVRAQVGGGVVGGGWRGCRACRFDVRRHGWRDRHGRKRARRLAAVAGPSQIESGRSQDNARRFRAVDHIFGSGLARLRVIRLACTLDFTMIRTLLESFQEHELVNEFSQTLGFCRARSLPRAITPVWTSYFSIECMSLYVGSYLEIASCRGGTPRQRFAARAIRRGADSRRRDAGHASVEVVKVY